MKRSDPAAATFLLDNNVFVSAIMDPARETATLRLILEMIRNKDIALVGNEFLAEEMARYAESFRSETAALLLHALLVFVGVHILGVIPCLLHHATKSFAGAGKTAPAALH